MDTAEMGTGTPHCSAWGLQRDGRDRQGHSVPTRVMDLGPFAIGNRGAQRAEGGEAGWLKWMEKQAEGPCPSLLLICPVPYPFLAPGLVPFQALASRTGALGSSSGIFLWRWCLGTREESQASGVASPWPALKARRGVADEKPRRPRSACPNIAWHPSQAARKRAS